LGKYGLDKEGNINKKGVQINVGELWGGTKRTKKDSQKKPILIF
jgi:hypothetical protein